MAASTKRSGRVNRRSEILRAAEVLMHSRGFSGITTRQNGRMAFSELMYRVRPSSGLFARR